ncbi:hypothetical protein OV079_23905 [Nannocystis pusilla]|uniref:Uncharacterized protein n=1 Tax=Nannocystis pusilla TaxID=889268 RepID=A0A9X3EH97_9BACT|nr:hypothetical protein [Nannocystis pusilla]MCY1004022.1 hypothetical protein [Nannocystis pusilla]MCY1008548.1 hypothetical protein [Nannocystis pusilla]
MPRMWITGPGRRWLAPYIESSVPGLVLVCVRPGLWRVTHKLSGFGVGPLFGIRKAREFAVAVDGDVDWTQPASEISSAHAESGLSDGALLREAMTVAVVGWWSRLSPRRRGWSRRLRRTHGE